MIFRSLTTKVIVLSIILLSFGIGIFTFLNLRKEKIQLENAARESTELLLNTIERSIYNSMRIGDTQDTQIILQMVGQSHKLANVRIFHPQGIILKSANPAEVGRPVRPEDYLLFLNTKKEAIFSIEGKGEVLSMVKPIYNDEACYHCHGRKTRVIGVLNVNYSLEETRKRIVAATKLFAVSTATIIAILSIGIALVMLRFVKQPLTRISENMALIEEGDLSVRVEHSGKDEVGRLVTRFNSMVDRLDVAKKELDQLHFQQMERADRLASVGEMAAGIAHEIKNPLTGISAAISIISQDFSDTDPRKEILGEVLEQVKRLDKTVNDLLFFGKPMQPEFIHTDINHLIRKTLLFASQHRGGKNIEKRLQLQEGLPPVLVDGNQLQQVLLNLILNAIQAMQNGGTLTVQTSLEPGSDGDRVLIRIGDTGPGIPPQIVDKIFTPFFTTKAQGTGLGLAICHKLVVQHNGTISVKSEDGVGTVFTIELPAAPIHG